MQEHRSEKAPVLVVERNAEPEHGPPVDERQNVGTHCRDSAPDHREEDAQARKHDRRRHEDVRRLDPQCRAEIAHGPVLGADSLRLIGQVGQEPRRKLRQRGRQRAIALAFRPVLVPDHTEELAEGVSQRRPELVLARL